MCAICLLHLNFAIPDYVVMLAKHNIHYLYSLSPDNPDSLKSYDTDSKSSNKFANSLVITMGIDSMFLASLYALTLLTA